MIAAVLIKSKRPPTGWARHRNLGLQSFARACSNLMEEYLTQVLRSSTALCLHRSGRHLRVISDREFAHASAGFVDSHRVAAA